MSPGVNETEFLGLSHYTSNVFLYTLPVRENFSSSACSFCKLGSYFVYD